MRALSLVQKAAARKRLENADEVASSAANLLKALASPRVLVMKSKCSAPVALSGGVGRTRCCTPTLPGRQGSILWYKPLRQHRNVLSRSLASTA